jgi:histidinol-phosphatase (PHP family)
MIDLHTHHERCGHADGTLREVADRAIERGIAVLGFADHAPRFADAADHPRPGIQMARSEWDAYLREAAAVRADVSGRLDVRVGVEADWIPGSEAVYREALARPELDSVLGSVHEVGDWQIYQPHTFEHADPDAFHRGYWRAVASAAVSGLFDVLAHLDAIRIMVPPARIDLSAEREAALDAIADAGIAVEINGSGLRRDGRLFPDQPLLEGLVRRGVPVSFGSDAHALHQLGSGWDEARAALARLGVRRLITFSRREPVWWPLE